MFIDGVVVSVDRGVNDNFKFNQETEFVPIIGLIASQLNDSLEELGNKPGKVAASSIQENHHPALLSLLADELSVTREEIHDFELYVLLILVYNVEVLTQSKCTV